MNHMRYVPLLIALFLLPILAIDHAFAANEGFTTEEMTVGDQERVISFTDISVLSEEPPKWSIHCFDVRADGMIAVGASHSEERIVYIYSPDGMFQYGYQFRSSGTYGIEWRDDSLAIYFVRGDTEMVVSRSGTVEQIEHIQNTIENNTYWNHSVNVDKRIVGDSEYEMTNDMGFFNFFATSYSQLVVTHGDGTSEIIYDVNDEQLIRTVLYFIFWLSFCAVVVFTVIKTMIYARSNR